MHCTSVYRFYETKTTRPKEQVDTSTILVRNFSPLLSHRAQLHAHAPKKLRNTPVNLCSIEQIDLINIVFHQTIAECAFSAANGTFQIDHTLDQRACLNR